MVSAVIGHEDRDVLNEVLGNIGSLGSGDECGGSSGGRFERLDRIGQFPLKLEQFGCRLNQDVANSDNIVYPSSLRLCGRTCKP